MRSLFFYTNNNMRAIYSLSVMVMLSVVVYAAPLYTQISGAHAESHAGSAVAFGDVNGDGYMDIITVASVTSTIDAVYVVYGVSGNVRDFDLSIVTNMTGFKMVGAEHGTGEITLATGDVNADGITDVIIGSPNSDYNGRSSSGVVYIVFGTKSVRGDVDLNNMAPGSGFMIYGSESYYGAGWSVAVGDVNADGVDDVVIGAMGMLSGGMVHVVYGTAGVRRNLDLLNMDKTYGYTMVDGGEGNSVGHSVAVGDVNGDGVNDVVMGSPGRPSSHCLVHVVYGVKGQRSPNLISLNKLTASLGFNIRGAIGMDDLGYGVSVGDVNGDAVRDIMTGAYSAHDSDGIVYVVYGIRGSRSLYEDANNMNVSAGYTIIGVGGGFVGWSLASKDINNDGIDDVITGAFEAYDQTGAVYVVWGVHGTRPTVMLEDLDDSRGIVLKSFPGSVNAGSSLVVGDVDGDRRNEIITGAPDAEALGRSRCGAVYVVKPL